MQDPLKQIETVSGWYGNFTFEVVWGIVVLVASFVGRPRFDRWKQKRDEKKLKQDAELQKWVEHFATHPAALEQFRFAFFRQSHDYTRDLVMVTSSAIVMILAWALPGMTYRWPISFGAMYIWAFATPLFLRRNFMLAKNEKLMRQVLQKRRNDEEAERERLKKPL